MSRSHIPLLPQDHGRGPLDLPLHNQHQYDSSTIEGEDSTTNSDHAHDPHEEVTKIELFYDLFFVANLTVFTYIHDVSDSTSLLQYIWFFCVLWFTWYQVALYDVRYSRLDCMAARLSKVIQFSVMIIFAATGPMFHVGDHPGSEERFGSYEKTNSYYGAFTLALMTSRIVLAFEYYLIRRLYQHNYPETRRPLTALVVTYAFAAVVYGSVYHFFTDPGNSNAYIAWYIIGPVESLIATFVACSKQSSGLRCLDKLPVIKRPLSRIVTGESDKLCFSNKLLVERMSLLTLIILGEGAISIAKQCQTVAYAWSLTWNVVNVINILSSVLIIYFIYLLYFEWIEHNHHIDDRALSGSAIKLCILWSAATEKIRLLHQIDQDWTALHSRDETILRTNFARFKESTHTWNTSLTEITGDQAYMVKTYSDALDTINDRWRVAYAVEWLDEHLNDTVNLDQVNMTNVIRAHRMLNYTAYTSVYTIAGFSKTKLETEEAEFEVDTFDIEDPFWIEKLDANGTGETKFLKETRNHFRLTYKYLFTSIGLVVLLCALLAYLGQPEETRTLGARRHWRHAWVRGAWYHRLRLSVTALVGVALCLLALKSITRDEVFMRSVSTPWMLPTIMGSLLLAVLVNSIKLDVPALHFLAWIFGKPATIKPRHSYDVDKHGSSRSTSPKGSSQQDMIHTGAPGDDDYEQVGPGGRHDDNDHAALEMQRMLRGDFIGFQ